MSNTILGLPYKLHTNPNETRAFMQVKPDDDSIWLCIETKQYHYALRPFKKPQEDGGGILYSDILRFSTEGYSTIDDALKALLMEVCRMFGQILLDGTGTEVPNGLILHPVKSKDIK